MIKVLLCYLERRSLRKTFYAAFQYLQQGCKKDGERVFIRVCSDRTQGSTFKLKEGRFRLDIREEILYDADGGTLEHVAQRSDL